MEAKEIRKFVGMEQGMRPLNPLPPFPPTELLTDGSKGGWVDKLEGLKRCSLVLGPEESVTLRRWGAERHLWRESRGV